jgi:serine/threonine protein kinase
MLWADESIRCPSGAVLLIPPSPSYLGAFGSISFGLTAQAYIVKLNCHGCRDRFDCRRFRDPGARLVRFVGARLLCPAFADIEFLRCEVDEITAMMREVSVFMKVHHAHICNLYRLSVVDQELVLFMEFAVRGTLLKHVNGCSGLKEPDTQCLFGQLFNAVRHLHACHPLVHRDLKFENVLLDARENVKLTDFGLSSTCYGNVMRTFVGTGDYQAPEILAGCE